MVFVGKFSRIKYPVDLLFIKSFSGIFNFKGKIDLFFVDVFKIDLKTDMTFFCVFYGI